MDDPFLVSGLDGLGDLSGNHERLIERNRASSNPIRQCGALDEFENQGPNAVGLLEAVDARDVGMVQRRKHLRFSQEAPHALGIEGERLGSTFSATSRCSLVSRAR